MHFRANHILLAGLAFLSAAFVPLHAQQQQKDEGKVLLISAQSAQLIEENGENYRKVIGPARFLHNDTYLLCDTALWNVNTNIIDAIGHVRIIQDQTQLSSETLQYVVDDNMAKFRGSLVQLEDSDKNTLRTRYLDYNTKDSVAIFQDGAAMRDKDGQIIESIFGTYDSKARLFVFNDQVNMYLDTTFVKTSRLEYRSDLSTAYFGYNTDMWQDDKMLSAHDGWYDRNHEVFFFRRRVHVLSTDQETWSDSLYYFRDRNDAELLGNVEMMDTTRNVYALAGRIQYMDSLSQVRMTRDPAIMSITDEKGVRDTLYVGSDVLLLRGIPRCDIPEAWVTDAEKRLQDLSGDPVMEYRKKAAEEAAKAAEEAAAKNNQNQRPPQPGAKPPQESQPPKPPQNEAPPAPPTPPTPPAPPAPADTSAQSAPTDSLALPAPTDSLALQAVTDTLPPPKDTTKINFLWGSKRVRMFRRNMQMVADSLTYSDLDSLVRLYQNPVFYHEGNRQYVGDSIFVVVKDQQMQRAHLLSNAFITIEEAPKCYDQIKGTEMVAYFDSTNALTRFDALGGASSLFYLEEDGVLATVNKVESKMIYATFKDGDLDHLYYYENPKNDGYPSVQLPEDERTLKGFRWEPDQRPKSPKDVTPLVPRKSERYAYLARPHTEFKQTETYFPGHVKSIYRDIAIRDSLQVARERARQQVEAIKDLPDTSGRQLSPVDTLQAPPVDSLKAPLDSLKAPVDSLKAPLDSLQAPLDSLQTPLDSLQTPADSLQAPPRELTAKEKKAQEKAAKQAEREAKWAEEDRIYEEKQAAKAQKKLEKERARKLKQLKKLERRAQRDRRRLERYLEKERKRALRKKEIK